MKRILTGDRVELLRDIYRAPDVAGLTRDLVRYAREGDPGTVVEVFRPQPCGCGEVKPLYAKVMMGSGRIKTFRLTSLGKVEK